MSRRWSRRLPPPARAHLALTKTRAATSNDLMHRVRQKWRELPAPGPLHARPGFRPPREKLRTQLPCPRSAPPGLARAVRPPADVAERWRTARKYRCAILRRGRNDRGKSPRTARTSAATRPPCGFRPYGREPNRRLVHCQGMPSLLHFRDTFCMVASGSTSPPEGAACPDKIETYHQLRTLNHHRNLALGGPSARGTGRQRRDKQRGEYEGEACACHGRAGIRSAGQWSRAGPRPDLRPAPGSIQRAGPDFAVVQDGKTFRPGLHEGTAGIPEHFQALCVDPTRTACAYKYYGHQ